MSGLVNLLVSYHTSWQWENEWSSLQERGRFVSVLLAERLKRAGNADCLHPHQVNQSNAISGYSDTDAPANLQQGVAPHSDVIIIGECLRYHRHRQFLQMAYFISDTLRKNGRGDPIYALYQKPLHGEREELIANVSQFHVRYGVTDGTHIVAYQRGREVHDWRVVRSVMLSLVLNADDHRLQRPWNMYIALRER